jgi:hypothetical protein
MNLDQALLDQLANIGPEGAGYVRALATASDTELANLANTYQQGGDTATQALLQAFDIKDVNPSVISLVTRTEDSLRDRVNSTDWASIGHDVDAGFAGGMDRYAYLVEQASMRIANIPQAVIRAENDMHSPSKLMYKLGTWIGEPYAEGIGSTERTVAAAMHNIADVSKYIQFPQYVTGSFSSPAASYARTGGPGAMRELVEALDERPMIIQTSVQLDGRELAKAGTPYITEEQNQQATFAALRKGERAS